MKTWQVTLDFNVPDDTTKEELSVVVHQWLWGRGIQSIRLRPVNIGHFHIGGTEFDSTDQNHLNIV